MKSLNQKQFDLLEKSEKKNYIKEWLCTCKERGKKWGFLDSVESQMKSQVSTNACMHLIYFRFYTSRKI